MRPRNSVSIGLEIYHDALFAFSLTLRALIRDLVEVPCTVNRRELHVPATLDAKNKLRRKEARRITIHAHCNVALTSSDLRGGSTVASDPRVSEVTMEP